ncbi:MAG: hypothetical protein ABR531_02380, partial [Bacteroidales bacterium]
MLITVFTALFLTAAVAQEPASEPVTEPVSELVSELVSDNLRKDAVRLFLDCSRCDMSYTRQEIPWVNYVRQVQDAQVYVLVTRQNSGNGGTMYTYIFHGMDKFAGMNDTLTYTSNPQNTSVEIREKRTNLLKAGLLRFASRTSAINEIEISHS